MLDICLLGTGGMMPLPRRYLTSLMARYNGMNILIDCGEGTQMALRQKGWSPNPIGIMCFTHYHADHISGLPGMLLNMGNAERTQPLLMVGPKGLERVVRGLRVIAPELPFPIGYHELTEEEEQIGFPGGYITGFRVKHNVTCYGYSITVTRQGRFDAQKAKELGIPLRCWNPLQHGQTVEYEGKTYTPELVMGAARKGLKVTYCTDTRPTESILRNAAGSDLFICEGMYGEAEKEENAKANRHMMMQEAAELAAQAKVGELWLTHYSPAMMKPELYMDEVRAIFPKATAAKDGRSLELKYKDEEE